MDNLYLQPEGFLGTGASLLADLTLLAYILLIIPGMLAGFVFARRKLHRPHHQIVMIVITLVNWLLIIFLMLTAYRFDVVSNISSAPANPRYLMPAIHGALGLLAQLFASYVVIRMIMEDINVARAKRRGEKNLSEYWFKSAKPFMWLTLTLWLVTSLLGVANYVIRYDLISLDNLGGNVPPPVVTEELETAEAPVETPEVSSTEEVEPLATPESTPELEPVETPEVAETSEVAQTPEVAETPEVEDEDRDDDNRGRGSDDEDHKDDNRGHGSDDD